MTRQDRPTLAIAFILFAVLAISVNDMIIKRFSGAYPLHELVLARSALGLIITLALLQFEGGLAALRTGALGWHVLRGLMLVIANSAFFAALAVLPLAETTALFFVAPLFITVLSIPILGEKVGPLRLTAVVVGFAGVLLMQRPWQSGSDASRLVLLLPVLAAFTYAMNQILTRKLGVRAPASVLAIYIQLTFIAVSLLVWISVGDGRFADQVSDPSLKFLLRAWVWPSPEDLPYLLGLGAISGIVGYTMSQSYRLASAATVAPFEYVGLPLSIFWGWAMFGELPDLIVWLGIGLILGSGLFVFLREQMKKKRKITKPAGGRVA